MFILAGGLGISLVVASRCILKPELEGEWLLGGDFVLIRDTLHPGGGEFLFVFVLPLVSLYSSSSSDRPSDTLLLSYKPAIVLLPKSDEGVILVLDLERDLGLVVGISDFPAKGRTRGRSS